MTLFLIPLVNIPQQFEIALGGVNYIMTLKYNDALEGGWVFDLADAVTNTPICCNIALTTGVNLLDGLEYLGIEGELFVYTDGAQFAVPTLLNLGVESNLYFQTDVVVA